MLIEGRRSGYVTPCSIALDTDERYRIRLELPGFEPRELILEPTDRYERIPWSDGRAARDGPSSPTSLTASEFFVPYRHDEAHSPSRIFIRLKPVSEPTDTN